MTEEELEALLKDSLDQAYQRGREEGIATAAEYTKQYADRLRVHEKTADGIHHSVYTLDLLTEALEDGTVR